MAKGYWIGRVDVHNDEGYKAYAAANPAIFKKFGGRYVIRGGTFTGGAFAAAAESLPDAQRGRALGWIVTGQSLALVLGVPFVAFIGAYVGWRGALLVQGVAVVIAAVLVWLAVAPQPAGSIKTAMPATTWSPIRCSAACFQIDGRSSLFTSYPRPRYVSAEASPWSDRDATAQRRDRIVAAGRVDSRQHADRRTIRLAHGG